MDDSISEAGVSLCDASVGCEEVKGVRVFGGAQVPSAVVVAVKPENHVFCRWFKKMQL